MTPEDRRALVTEYIDKVWNRGDLLALHALTTPAFQYQLGGQAPRDHSGMEQFLALTRAAFPDWRVNIHEMAAERDIVAVRWSGTVTHRGLFHGIEPTGREIHVGGINMYGLTDGRISHEWEQTDTFSMLRQLGLCA